MYIHMCLRVYIYIYIYTHIWEYDDDDDGDDDDDDDDEEDACLRYMMNRNRQMRGCQIDDTGIAK